MSVLGCFHICESHLQQHVLPYSLNTKKDSLEPTFQVLALDFSSCALRLPSAYKLTFSLVQSNISEKKLVAETRFIRLMLLCFLLQKVGH